MEDTTTTTPPLPLRVGHVLRLAEIIKEVDAKNDSNTFVLGAAALAEAILKHPGFSGCHDAPAALPAQGEVGELVKWLAEEAEAYRQTFGTTLASENLARTATLLQQASFNLGSSTAPTVGQPTTPPPLPPGYIDPEYQGEDRKLLEAFQRAWWAESGSSDKCHMAGIRAVLALRPTVAAVRAADAAISNEDLEAEFRAWWKANVHPLNVPAYHTITTHLAWGRHLLSRGEL